MTMVSVHEGSDQRGKGRIKKKEVEHAEMEYNTSRQLTCNQKLDIFITSDRNKVRLELGLWRDIYSSLKSVTNEIQCWSNLCELSDWNITISI